MKSPSSPRPTCARSYQNNSFYRSANDSTIKVYDDRIEFFNPGVLLDNLTVEKIKTGHYKSHLRNKQVATIFKELELIEKYGSGVRRVIDTFIAYGLPEPEFEATQGGMAVTVFNAVNGGVGSEKSSEKILRHLRTEPTLSAKALAEKLDVSPRAVEKQIDQLKKEGSLRRIGPAKGGHWEVIE
jgi:ATP-dependent DNA helicase RecG